MDKLLVRAIKETLSLDKKVLFVIISLFVTGILYLPVVLFIINLTIFVQLHIPLLVLSSILLFFLPQVYLYLYYRVMKYYENDATFDKINRLALISGIPFSILIGIGIGYVIYQYGGLL
jgi:energy-coupling factor transporter transmembrane protein EcfT